MHNNGQSCEICKFWDDASPGEGPWEEDINPEKPTGLIQLVKMGWCLRYPPIAQPNDDEVDVPITNFNHWCGEWKAID